MPTRRQWRAEKIATLKDATNKPQPITTGVRIEIDQNNNVDRYLFVGTGKLLDQQDLVDTSVINSFYVIRDGTWTTPEPAPAVPYSRANLTAITGSSVAGLGGRADRPRLVPGRHRRQPQDQLATSTPTSTSPCTDSRSRRRTRASPCCRRRCTRAISRPATRCSSPGSGTIVASVDIAGGIAGVALIQADPGASVGDAAGARSGDDDERPGGEHSGEHRGRGDAQAPRHVGARQSVA